MDITSAEAENSPNIDLDDPRIEAILARRSLSTDSAIAVASRQPAGPAALELELVVVLAAVELVAAADAVEPLEPELAAVVAAAIELAAERAEPLANLALLAFGTAALFEFEALAALGYFLLD